jgi:hypothetical protein
VIAMKKWTKNPWVLGIGTTVIGGVLLSLALDWINGVDWLSTTSTVMRFILNAAIAFLNFKIKVWWLLIVIAVIVIALFIVAKISDVYSKDVTPTFLHYTKDNVLGFSWEWDYSKPSMVNILSATYIQFAQNVVCVSNKVARMDWG